MSNEKAGCPEQVYPPDAWGSGWRCNRPIKRNGYCGTHARMHEQRAKKREDWQKRWPAKTAGGDQ